MASDSTRLANIILMLAVIHSQVCKVSSISSSSSDMGLWSSWTTCNTECGPGIQDRTRQCLTGACRAESEVQTRSCQVKACPTSQPSFRQKACSSYNRRVFSGKRYDWESYIRSSDPCKLTCRAKGIAFYASLPARVRDGELCHRPGEPKAICFSGTCKPVGCDDVVLSPARNDECGVCQGDGSDCKTLSGVFTSNQLPRGINHVITIPAGSTNINITELSPSENQMLLQGSAGQLYLNVGRGRPTSYAFPAAGTTVRYLGKTSINPRESLLSSGPTNSTIYVKLFSRGSVPNIQYTFSVPIQYDTEALTLGTIQRPVVKTAPLYVKDDDVTLSALHGADQGDSEQKGNQMTDDSTTVNELEEEVVGRPTTDSNDKAKESVELNESDPDLLEASGEVGVEILDSGHGGSSEIVSSYDVSIRKEGVAVKENGYGDSDEDADDKDYDDGDDDTKEEKGNESSVNKPGYFNKPKTEHHSVATQRTNTLPYSKEVMEYEGTHEIDVTYFNNDYSYGSSSISGDSYEISRGSNVDRAEESTSRPEVHQPSSGQNEKRFKLPKFSNSFTFGSKYAFPSSSKKNKIRPSQQPRRQINTAGSVARPVAPATPVVKAKSNVDLERERLVRERQAMIEAREERLRKRMEAYNQRLKDYQDKLKQRRREALQRRYGESSNRGFRKSTGISGTQYHLKIGNGRTNVNVAVAPSSSSSSSSSTSTFERSVFIDSNGNVNPSPTIVRKVNLSDREVRQPQTSNRNNLPGIRGGGRETISRVDLTNTLSRRNSFPRVDRNNGREAIPQTRDHRNDDSPLNPPKIRPVIADNRNSRQSTSPQNNRRIISRISRPVNFPTDPNLVSPGSGVHQLSVRGDRVVVDSRRIVRPIVNRPEYIPNERGIHTSALSGGDPSVIPSRSDDIIPNRRQTSDYRSGVPDSRIQNVKPTLATAEEPGTFSDNEWRISGLTECTHSCGGGVQQTVVVCVDTRTQAVVTDDNCGQYRRPEVKAVTCNKRPCPARWVPSAWSSCSVTCGDGEQTRTVSCLTRVSPTLNLTMPESSCQHSESPVQRRACNPQPCSSWTVGNWSECSSDCGDGVKTRDVNCVGLDQEILDDDQCSSLKPNTQKPCSLGTCGKGWFFTAWPEECPVKCGSGVLTRKVFCSSEDGQALPENRCDVTNRPQTTRRCKVDTPCGGVWYTSPWSPCNSTCGTGAKTRDVLCVKMMPGGLYAVVSEENCAGDPKPDTLSACEEPPCQPVWYTTSWGQCSQTCGNGYKTRELKCLNTIQRNSDKCSLQDRPRTRQLCNVKSCVVVKPSNPTPTGNESCRDKFSQCRVVKRARLCKYAFYKKVCCKTCS